ncbi:hypothetical protein C2E21_4807 [Chlorella sorokiniana]|uniref:DNA-directed RNA polymerase RBP11-like dimerisation domain-containing protein n=1 Tax=Chlorella sorokiniana TaxID=3076 RepID=A0A2P6TS04_CHLSO|nr:hypothetical protein C2E21_4807 [Chlorella sorokiniana]|eukprot:PRW56845.1 hypothetical protein C2E21_4807 [Chlorella sorokiniana]
MARELVAHEGAAAAVDDAHEDDGRSIVLALQDETHTLGNALRDVMWSHPHVQLASYTQEHPSSQEILLRCQTNGAVSAEQGVVEALHIMQQMLRHMGSTMEAAAADWQAGQQGEQQQRQQEQDGGGRGSQAADGEAEAMEEDS